MSPIPFSNLFEPSRTISNPVQKNSSFVEFNFDPPRSYGQRLELVKGASARGLTCHCADEAGYMCSPPLHICRVVLFLLRQRRGTGLGELQRARGRSKYFATAPARTQRALYGAEARKVRVVKPLNFPVRDTRARAIGKSCFPCKTSTRSFLRSSALLRPFSPACSPPPGCFFARDCAHSGGPAR